MVLVVGVPFAWAIYLSFTDAIGGSLTGHWVGFDNFRQVFHDPLFYKALGNTAFMILRIPLTMTASLAIAILSFMGAWNDFMGPLIYLRDQTKFPLSLGLYGLGLSRSESGADYSWTVVMAGNMLMTLPVIGVFFLFQRYFVQGMTMTGMKG